MSLTWSIPGIRNAFANCLRSRSELSSPSPPSASGSWSARSSGCPFPAGCLWSLRVGNQHKMLANPERPKLKPMPPNAALYKEQPRKPKPSYNKFCSSISESLSGPCTIVAQSCSVLLKLILGASLSLNSLPDAGCKRITFSAQI